MRSRFLMVSGVRMALSNPNAHKKTKEKGQRVIPKMNSADAGSIPNMRKVV